MYIDYSVVSLFSGKILFPLEDLSLFDFGRNMTLQAFLNAIDFVYRGYTTSLKALASKRATGRTSSFERQIAHIIQRGHDRTADRKLLLIDGLENNRPLKQTATMALDMLHEYEILRQISRLLNMTETDFPASMDFRSRSDVVEDLFNTRYDSFSDALHDGDEVKAIALHSTFKLKTHSKEASRMLLSNSDDELGSNDTIKAVFLVATQELVARCNESDMRTFLEGHHSFQNLFTTIAEICPLAKRAILESLPASNRHIRALFKQDIIDALPAPITERLCNLRVIENCDPSTENAILTSPSFFGSNSSKTALMMRKLTTSPQLANDPRFQYWVKMTQQRLLTNMPLSEMMNGNLTEAMVASAERKLLRDSITTFNLTPAQVGLVNPRMAEEDPLVRMLFREFFETRLNLMKRHIAGLDTMVDRIADIMKADGLTGNQALALRQLRNTLDASNQFVLTRQVKLYYDFTDFLTFSHFLGQPTGKQGDCEGENVEAHHVAEDLRDQKDGKDPRSYQGRLSVKRPGHVVPRTLGQNVPSDIGASPDLKGAQILAFLILDLLRP